jgi:hypothetical protein
MARAYSQDLRDRVIDAALSGASARRAAARFGIGEATAIVWVRRAREAAPEVDVGGCEIAETLVVAAVVVMIDERRDLPFEITWQEVVFQQDAVLQSLVPSLIFGIRFEYPAQMRLAQDNDVFTHSRRIDPISRSAKPFCQGALV